MKRLVVFRHAKTERESPGGDKARELTNRGERNAAEMGEAIRKHAGVPDLIVSSDAVRAVQTSEIAARTMGYTGEVRLESILYHEPFEGLMNAVRQLPDEANTVVVVGHNPGIEQLAGWIAGDASEFGRLPTAGWVAVELDIKRWADAGPEHARAAHLDTPKKS